MARKIDTKPSKNSRLHRARWWPPHVTAKRLIIISSGLAIVVICAYGGLVLYHKLVVQDNDKQTLSQGHNRTPPQDELDTQSLSGDTDEVSKIVAERVEQTDPKNKQAIADLYLQEAQAYLNNGKFKQALAIAKQAESESPSVTSADMIANCYKVLGDKDSALKYYKLELDRYGSDDMNAGDSMGRNDILREIKNLGG